MGIGNTKPSVQYYRPLAEGIITKKITEEEYKRRIEADPTDNIRKRVYTDSKEEEQTVYEEYYSSVTGLIVGIEFKTHDDYGTSIELTLRTEDGTEGILAVNTSGGYGTSLLETLPNVDVEKEVTINAWSKDKRKVMFVAQEGENLNSAFRKWDDKKKEWKFLKKDYPQVDEKEKEKFGKKYWGIYFAELEVYLTDYIGKEVAPKINIADVVEDKKEGEIDSDDIAF